MKALFISNFMNHHQKDFCDYLYHRCEEFFFVCRCVIPKETLKFGYDDLSALPYIVSADEQPGEWIAQKVLEADVVIFGDSSHHFLQKRMEVNKLSFIYSERMWKKGYYRRWIPLCRKKATNTFTRYADKNLRVLAASCYLAKDIAMVGFPPNKCYQWGYFTPLEIIENPENTYDQKQDHSIIWVGRLVPLKHLEELLKALSVLKEEGFVFTLTVVGDGSEKESWENLSRKLKIDSRVIFKGSMPSSQVRKEMKKAQIFVATSDFNEGWGAVINEAMNSVCVPIVSHAMGASAFLIDHGKNGLIYKSGSIQSLEKCLKTVLDDQEYSKRMAIAAYHTIREEYNGSVAAERFLKVANMLLAGDTGCPYQTGPMSISPLFKNNWIDGVKHE